MRIETPSLALDGLTESQVQERVTSGKVNEVPTRPSRTVKEIVRANVFTRFNALLGALLVVILIVGPYQDALFGFVLVGNTLIGIVQELRAKRTLDRLAVLTAPKARLVRDGTVRQLPVWSVVLDDVLELQPGDQVVVDGVVLDSQGLEVDESLVSGESEPAEKRAGDGVLSGSFVAAGSGRYRATRVGREAYAVRLAEEARRFELTKSELRAGIDRILQLVTWVLVPTAILLAVSQVGSNASLYDALRGSVAGTVAMVPEGLVLLTSIAFAVGVVRLARRRVLAQELPAVEVLARVDVLCIDKTGTLTEGRLAVEDVLPLASGQPYALALGALAASDPIQTPRSSPSSRGSPRSRRGGPTGRCRSPRTASGAPRPSGSTGRGCWGPPRCCWPMPRTRRRPGGPPSSRKQVGGWSWRHGPGKPWTMSGSPAGWTPWHSWSWETGSGRLPPRPSHTSPVRRSR